MGQLLIIRRKRERERQLQVAEEKVALDISSAFQDFVISYLKFNVIAKGLNVGLNTWQL